MFARNTKHIIQSVAVRGKAMPKASMPSIRFFSSTTDNNDSNNKKTKTTSVPTEYYHEETENERQLLEVISTLQNKKDFKSLSAIDKVMTWEDIHAAREAPLETMPDPLSMDDPEDSAATQNMDFDDLKAQDDVDEEIEDMVLRRKGWRDIDDLMMDRLINPELAGSLNLNLSTGSNAAMNDFPRRSAPESLNFATAALAESAERFQQNPDFPDFPEQGPCPGKLQRRGKAGILRCAKMDLDALHHLDIMTLRAYLTEDAEIQHRKHTGLCAKCQRQVARTIKKARNMGILPHIGNYDIQEFPRDDDERDETHTSVRIDKSYFQAKVHKN